MAFSPSGTQIVSGSYAAPKGEVRLWDVASRRSRNCEGHTQMVEAVAWSPDGWYAASSSLDKTIRLWDTATGREVRRFDHTDGVTAFAFSPDGRHIVSGHWFKGPLRIWDMATGESRLLEGHQQGVPVIVFSADGRHVASGSTDGTVRLWDVASGQSFCFKGHTDKAVDVAFSPDGRHIASASHDGRLGVWDVSSKQGRLFREGYAALYSIAFSPDGRHVVSGSRDSAVRLWDIASGQNRRFEGHTNTVWSVAFSPNGRHIISRSADGTLRLWEVTSGRELFRFEGESGGFDCLAVAADWKSLAAGDWAGQVHLFDILLGETGETISLRGLDDRGPDKPTEPPSTALPAQKAAPTRTEQIASPWYTMKIIQLGGGDTEFICRRCERSIEITPMRGERPPPACPYCLFEGQTAPGADLPRPLQ